MSLPKDPRQRFLGARRLCLARLNKAEARIRRTSPRFSLDTIPLDDPRTLRKFQQGECSRSVGPILGDRAIIKFLRGVKPQTITEIACAVALCRPGPRASGVADLFVARRNGTGRLRMPKTLQDVTATTRQVPVFQEQIVEASRLIAGFTMRRAESLRRALGRREPSDVARFRHLFVKGAIRRKHARRDAEHLFTFLEKFGSYTLQRAHCLEAAGLAYKAEYLLTHYSRG